MVMRILPRLIARECIVFADERLREVKMAISRECPAFYINHWDGVDKHGPNVEFRELEDWDELSAENTHTLVEIFALRPIRGEEQWVADYGSEYRRPGRRRSRSWSTLFFVHRSHVHVSTMETPGRSNGAAPGTA